MKKRNCLLSVLLCLSMLTGLAGCNSQNTAGNTGESASGAGIESSSTGSAIEEKAAVESFDSKYRYCNDYHLYTGTKNGFEQCTLEGEKLQAFSYDEISSGSKARITLVTNQEILYVVREKKKQAELWSIPLTGENHSPEMDKAYLVLKDEAMDYLDSLGFDTLIYADADYIAYFCSGDYVEYDRKQGEKIFFIDNKPKPDMSYTYPSDDEYVYEDGLLKNTVLLAARSSRYTGNEYKEPLEGLYVHRVGSGKVQKIDDRQYKREDGLDTCLSYGERIFYTKLEEQLGPVYVYDGRTGETKVFVTEEQIRQAAEPALEKKDFTDWYLLYLYITENRLYLEVFDTVDILHYMFSMPLEGGELVYEEELNQFIIQTHEDIGGPSYMSTIVENQCILQYGRFRDGAIYPSYNLETGERQDVKKNILLAYSSWAEGMGAKAYYEIK
ncbi:MAG: hypothetical protein J1F02_01715 [Lachnospiraceae bacterium]|nr:hypothetical protein [Lachnospiraceae bacterium]